MVAVKEPVLVEIIVEGLVVIGLLSNFIVIAVFAAKLTPKIVTTVPTRPEVGDNVIPLAVPLVTVNVVDSVFVPSVADII